MRPRYATIETKIVKKGPGKTPYFNHDILHNKKPIIGLRVSSDTNVTYVGKETSKSVSDFGTKKNWQPTNSAMSIMWSHYMPISTSITRLWIRSSRTCTPASRRPRCILRLRELIATGPPKMTSFRWSF